MIYFYSGTPGSGKSLHVAQDIYTKLFLKKQNVIANFPINQQIYNNAKKKGKFLYLDNSQLTVKFLEEYARKNHVIGKEGQTLVVIDECQILFNPREFNRNDRLEWITFFTMHRHLGYNFILISQFDRLVDRQIRSLFEYDIKHRKVNNFKFMRFIPFIKLFVAVTYWYGVKEKVDVDFFIFKKKYGDLYNSYARFENTSTN